MVNFTSHFFDFFYRMSYGLTFLGVFMMWLVWVCAYMHQMNPLIKPLIDTSEK